MLGLLGLRIVEAAGADITDLGEEHGHRVLRVVGKGTKVVLVPLAPAVARAWPAPRFPDCGICGWLCCFQFVQVFGADFMRSPVAEC
jgi:hypothetical protein